MIKQRKKLNQYAVSTNTLDDPTGNSEFVLIIHEMSLTDATELGFYNSHVSESLEAWCPGFGAKPQVKLWLKEIPEKGIRYDNTSGNKGLSTLVLNSDIWMIHHSIYYSDPLALSNEHTTTGINLSGFQLASFLEKTYRREIIETN